MGSSEIFWIWQSDLRNQKREMDRCGVFPELRRMGPSNLFLCLDVSDMGKSMETTGIQHGGGFQNSYIWAQRN